MLRFRKEIETERVKFLDDLSKFYYLGLDLLKVQPVCVCVS